MKSVGGLFLCAIALSAQTGAVVDGTIINSATQGPVPEVEVTLGPPPLQSGPSYRVTTDTSGKFRISSVQPGEYRLICQREGFDEKVQPVHVNLGPAARVDAELDPLATVRGRVLDPEGKPVARAPVGVGLNAARGYETDADGQFQIKGLRPGAYWLRARVPPPSAASKPAQTPQPDSVVPTYYPSVLTESEAELIHVRPGADLAGYDIHLRTSRVYRIHGVVLDETGKPVPNVTVSLFRRGEARILSGRTSFGSQQYATNRQGHRNPEETTRSSKEGEFEFASATPGDWELQATGNFPEKDKRPGIALTNLVTASVSNRDADPIELRFAPPLEVAITEDWGDQQTPPQDRAPVPSLMLTTGGIVFQLGNGSKLNVPAVSYRVIPLSSRAPGFYSAAAMITGHDVQGQDVELSSNTTIQIVYRPNAGTIRGTVRQDQAATVLLWRLGSSAPDLVPVVQAGAHGAFEFSSLAPGDYSVIAFDHVPPEGAPSAFASTILARGTRVSLQERGVESVQIDVLRWGD